jgi:fumarate hydratase subunit alpha
MREISADKIVETVKNLCIEASYNLSEDVEEALTQALAKEESDIGREIIRELLKNAEIARKDKLPICQDTGIVVVFLEIGQDVLITGGDIHGAINEGVIEGYQNLRKSVVSDPFKRKNTGDNTPAIIHTEIVPGDKLKIGILPKGGGAENASSVKMFLPTAKKEDIIKYVVDCTIATGPKACPPLIIGVGIGGSLDYCAYLAKKALTRKVNRNHSNLEIAELEREMLKEVNKSGVGPMGLGGRVTALAVHIEEFPCHIASLPVAVNYECHAHRYKEAIL